MRTKINLLFICLFAVFSSIFAQGSDFEETIKLDNGFYKVKSGGVYGLIDEAGRVVVSVEYEDIKFREGKALLTKNDFLIGIVDSLGNISRVESGYKVHPLFRYVYEGFIPVTYTEKKVLRDKWGFIDIYGKPLRFPKVRGLLNFSKKYPTMFGQVSPFVEGYVSVYVKDKGWKQYDASGKEHFKMRNEEDVIFRTSPYKGECVIITKSGIKLCQEDQDGYAVVKRPLSSSAHLSSYSDNKDCISFEEGELELDSLMRAVKFTNQDIEHYFIKKAPRKVKVVEVDTVKPEILVIEDNLAISLSSSYLRANSRGLANVKVKIKNQTNDFYEGLSVHMNCLNLERECNVNLDPHSEVSLSLSNIPARFSSASIKRNINVVVEYKGQKIEQNFPVTIKRYKPVR